MQLNHKKLDVYQSIRELTKEVYILSSILPSEEKFNMVQQIRRAVLSVKLNLAEGATRRSGLERKRYLEIARGSLVELDAAFETAVGLSYYVINTLENFSKLLNKCFAMISKMMDKS